MTEPGCGRKIFPAAWGLRSPGDAEVEFGMALGGGNTSGCVVRVQKEGRGAACAV